MRPTVTEQLDGVCRILDEVITPALAAEHTRETLRNLVANVRMLARNWPRLLPFLNWDNTACAALLVALRASAAPDLQARIAATLATAPADPADIEAIKTHNEALRKCLSAYLLAGCSAEHRTRIGAHLAERAARYPLRLTGAQPKPRAAAAGAPC